MKRKISRFKLALLVIGLSMVFFGVILILHGYDVLIGSKGLYMENMFSRTLDSLIYLLGGSLVLIFGVAFAYYSQVGGMFIYERR